MIIDLDGKMRWYIGIVDGLQSQAVIIFAPGHVEKGSMLATLKLTTRSSCFYERFRVNDIPGHGSIATCVRCDDL